MSDSANFAPKDEDKIDGEQEELGFDGVAVFCDGISEIIGNGIDEESGSVEEPPARAAR